MTAISKEMSSIASIATCHARRAFRALSLCCWLRLRAPVCERERARAARCAAMHLSLRAQRLTTAQRCHGGARQTEELRASGSTAHK